MWAIGLHGGAGPLSGFSPKDDVAALEVALAAGVEALQAGEAAIDVVEKAIRILEDSGKFIAGKGACPNHEGDFELDAAICDGASRKVGAVAAMAGVYPPISIARAVMDKTNNVLLAGKGAMDFALSQNFPKIADPGSFFTPSSSLRGGPDATVHGTVGAVVLDCKGHLAAGTSTGGTIGKRPGRIGDSPIPGSGTWADASVAISCTGQGEYFLRTAAAHSVAIKYRNPSNTLEMALNAAIGEIAELGGEGGILSVELHGEVRYAFNSQGMRVATASSLDPRGARIESRIFK